MASGFFFSMLKHILLVQKGSQTQVTFKVLNIGKSCVQERLYGPRIPLSPRLVSQRAHLLVFWQFQSQVDFSISTINDTSFIMNVHL